MRRCEDRSNRKGKLVGKGRKPEDEEVFSTHTAKADVLHYCDRCYLPICIGDEMTIATAAGPRGLAAYRYHPECA